MNFLFKTLVLASFLIGFTSCDKQETLCETEMTFQDQSRIFGCGFILVLDLDDEERRLQPTNLDKFDIVPENGQKVCVSFLVIDDVASACQVGEIVELTSIELK